MVNGMKGTLCVYVKGMALLTQPEDVIKCESKQFRKVIPKPQLPSIPERPLNPPSIDITSNVPFSVKVNEGGKREAVKKRLPLARSFFYDEAEESETEGEGGKMGQRQKRAKLGKVEPKRLIVDDNDDDDDDYDRNDELEKEKRENRYLLASDELEEGEIRDDKSDDSGISEFVTHDSVVECNNQEEARQQIERLKSSKNFPQYDNTGAGARNLNSAIQSIMAGIEKQKREKQRQNEQGACSSTQMGGVKDDSGVLQDKDLNLVQALRECRRMQQSTGVENSVDDDLYVSGSDDEQILRQGLDSVLREDYIEPSQSIE